MFGNIPVRAELAEDIECNLVSAPSFALGTLFIGEVGRRDMVNEPAEHLVAEGSVVLGVENELVPSRVDCVCRTADTRAGSAEIHELLHIDEQFFGLLVAQAKLDLETFDEFKILVTENLPDQIRTTILQDSQV